MVALLLYAYCVGLPSSRKIEKATHEQVPFRVISADQHPDHDAVAEFRRRHLKALAGLFVQVLQICQKAGLVKLGHVSLDGTKLQANASKHKAMSYGRMEAKAVELESHPPAGPGRSGRQRRRRDLRQRQTRRRTPRRPPFQTTAPRQARQEAKRQAAARSRRQTRGQSATQLHRSRVAHHARRRDQILRPKLQLPSRRRRRSASHRRDKRHSANQRQTASRAPDPRNGSCERRRAANHCIPMTCPKSSTHLNGVPTFSDKSYEYKRSDSSSTLNSRI